MRTRLCRLTLFTTLVLFATSGAFSNTYTGCYDCKLQNPGCLNTEVTCYWICKAAQDDEQGDGIYCKQERRWFGWTCDTWGGGCLAIYIEGEDPDCEGYCPR
ncbi:MAG: hypothetical protein AAF481_06240 [Acidobacteriota bacterium]